MLAISESLAVLNTLKNNLTNASQFQILMGLDTLDLSMNNITSFDEVGALFADGYACVFMCMCYACYIYIYMCVCIYIYMHVCAYVYVF